MAIILRTTKGSELTFAEMDGNFTDLDLRITALQNSAGAQTLTLTGTDLTISGGNTVSLSSLQGTSGITDVVQDTTPQLGGDLDVNGNSIVSASNGNISLAPDGTGYLHLGNGLTNTHRVGMYDRYFFPATVPNTGDVLTAGAVPNELEWAAPAAGGGGSVTLASFSVLQNNPSGLGSLTYNNTSGVFVYTPPDLSGLGGGASYADSDVDTHLNTSTATSNQVLSWDGADYVWVAQSSGGSTSTFQTAPVFEVGVIEEFDSLSSATGTVVHDCSSARLFNHSAMSADFTVNLTNIGLASGQASMVTLVLNQGNTAYMPTGLQIGGAVQTIVWQGNSQPSGTANGKDIVSFSILFNGASYIVLGQSVSYGGV